MGKTALSLALAASISALGIVIAHEARGPTVEEMQAIIKQYQTELLALQKEEASKSETEFFCEVQPAQTYRGEAFEQVVCSGLALSKEDSAKFVTKKLSDGRVAVPKAELENATKK